MKIFGRSFSFGRKSAAGALSIEQVQRRLEALYATASGIAVTPENCHESPTVKAILTAVERRFAVMPVHVYLKTTSKGRDNKELQANHPVERLLSAPNNWQTNVSFWMDFASWLLRYGNVYAFKARGQTGPIRRLVPLLPGSTEPKQDDNDLSLVTFETHLRSGGIRTFAADEILHARTSARDGLKGDSFINDVRESIALEIAAEKFGASFFGNGAMPGLTIQYKDGFQAPRTAETGNSFEDDLQEKLSSKRGRFRVLLLPKGMEFGDQIPVENEKAQFNQLRALQRTIIAGAAGVPPHLVGDLSKGTFNNVENQGIEFTTNVILPLTRVFEAAMERDLLTPSDRAGGIIIRFNPDATLRGDFKTRQEGLAIQRQNGVINANEWREREGMNPRSDAAGDAYYTTGPSGQGTTAGSASPQQNPGDPPADPNAPQQDNTNAA